jgi:septum formation protein
MGERSSARIILASASPRRKELLAQAGYRFTVFTPAIDESAFPTAHVTPTQYATKLALAKAKSVARTYPDCLVIGADTVVDFDGQIIGKPADAQHAEEVTRKLFSASHKVITAVAVVRLRDKLELCKSDSTTIYPKKLSDTQIAEHIKGGTWRDKAGAYAIRETGDEFIERIDGSLTNVMGLPMELLQRMLQRILP